jgi:hypothetical protein
MTNQPVSTAAESRLQHSSVSRIAEAAPHNNNKNEGDGGGGSLAEVEGKAWQ